MRIAPAPTKAARLLLVLASFSLVLAGLPAAAAAADGASPDGPPDDDLWAAMATFFQPLTGPLASWFTQGAGSQDAEPHDDAGVIDGPTGATVALRQPDGSLLDVRSGIGAADLEGADAMCVGVSTTLAGVDWHLPPSTGVTLRGSQDVVSVQEGLLCVTMDLAEVRPKVTEDLEGAPVLTMLLIAENGAAGQVQFPLYPRVVPPGLTDDLDGDGASNVQEISCEAGTVQQILFAMFDPSMNAGDCDGDGFNNFVETQQGTQMGCWTSHPNNPPGIELSASAISTEEGTSVAFTATAIEQDYQEGQNTIICHPRLGFTFIIGMGTPDPTAIDHMDFREAGAPLLRVNPTLELWPVRDQPSIACPDPVPGGATCDDTTTPGVASVSWDPIPYSLLPRGASEDYLFEFLAVDETGAQATGRTVVHVQDAVPPVVFTFDPSPFRLLEGESGSVTITVDDPDAETFDISLDLSEVPFCVETGPVGPRSTVVACAPDHEVVDHVDPADTDRAFGFDVSATSLVTPDRSGTEAATVEVEDVNRAPVMTCQACPADGAEDVEVSATFTVTDADDDEVTVTAADLPAGESGTLTDHGDGSYTYTWTPTFEFITHSDPAVGTRDQALDFTADDGWTPDPLTAMLSPMVTVADTNRSPDLRIEGQDGPYEVVMDEGDTVVTNLTATDPDGDAPSIRVAPDVAGAPFCRLEADAENVSKATLTCEPGHDVVAHLDPAATTLDLSMLLQAVDGWALDERIDEGVFEVTVHDVNAAPTVEIDHGASTLQATEAVSTIEVHFTVADVDTHDTLDVDVQGVPEGEAFTLTDHGGGAYTLRWSPSHDAVAHGPGLPEETFNLTIRAMDDWTPEPLEGEAWAHATVEDVNRAPQLDVQAVPGTVTEGSSVSFDVPVTDADGDAVTLEARILLDGEDAGENISASDDDGDGNWTVTWQVGNGFAVRGTPATVSLELSATDDWSLDPATTVHAAAVLVDYENAIPVVEEILTDARVAGPFANGVRMAYVLLGETVSLTATFRDDNQEDAQDLTCWVDFGTGALVAGQIASLGAGTYTCDASRTYDLVSGRIGHTVTVIVGDPDADGFARVTIHAIDPDADSDVDAHGMPAPDGVSDGDELSGVRNFEFGNAPTDPFDPDTDGDLDSDRVEMDARSDPNDINSNLDDFDGDGIVNPLDFGLDADLSSRSRQPGPLWLRLTYFDADGAQIPRKAVAAVPVNEDALRAIDHTCALVGVDVDDDGVAEVMQEACTPASGDLIPTELDPRDLRDALAYGYLRQYEVVLPPDELGLPNYPVTFTLDTAKLIADGKMRSDCGDIRFLDMESRMYLPHFLERETCDQESTTFLVKMDVPDGGEARDILVVYGRPGAEDASSGRDVFDIYSTFDDGDMDGWEDAELDIAPWDGCSRDFAPAKVSHVPGHGPAATKGPEEGRGFGCRVGIARTIEVDPALRLTIDLETRVVSDFAASIFTNAGITLTNGPSFASTVVNERFLYQGGTVDTGWNEFTIEAEARPGPTSTLFLWTHDFWADSVNKQVWFDDIVVRRVADIEPTASTSGPEIVNPTSVATLLNLVQNPPDPLETIEELSEAVPDAPVPTPTLPPFLSNDTSVDNGIVMMVHGHFEPSLNDLLDGTGAPLVPPAWEGLGSTQQDGDILLYAIPFSVATGLPLVVEEPQLRVHQPQLNRDRVSAPTEPADGHEVCEMETNLPGHEGPLNACLVFRFPATAFNGNGNVVTMQLEFDDPATGERSAEAYSAVTHYLLHASLEGGLVGLKEVDSLTGHKTPFLIEHLVDPVP